MDSFIACRRNFKCRRERPAILNFRSLALPASKKRKYLVGKNSLLRYFKPCVLCTNLHDTGMNILNCKVENETRTCTVEEIILWKQLHAAWRFIKQKSRILQLIKLKCKDVDLFEGKDGAFSSSITLNCVHHKINYPLNYCSSHLI